MSILMNKRIILGVSGSIAAYKSPDIVRRLQDLDAEVRVILTSGGREFVSERSLQTVSKNKVYDNLWDSEAELSMGHIELAKWADVVIIAPASANTIAKLCHGKADDLLSTYARRFLGRMDKAPVDSIDGLSPAIAINQKEIGRASCRERV